MYYYFVFSNAQIKPLRLRSKVRSSCRAAGPAARRFSVVFLKDTSAVCSRDVTFSIALYYSNSRDFKIGHSCGTYWAILLFYSVFWVLFAHTEHHWFKYSCKVQGRTDKDNRWRSLCGMCVWGEDRHQLVVWDLSHSYMHWISKQLNFILSKIKINQTTWSVYTACQSMYTCCWAEHSGSGRGGKRVRIWVWERNEETAGLNHPYRPMKNEVNIQVYEESAESKKGLQAWGRSMGGAVYLL